MTDTAEPTAEATAPEGAGAAAPKRRGGGLSSMLLADLKQMASGMGIAGAGAMKKAQLIEAIKGAQSSGATKQAPAERAKTPTQDAPARPERDSRPAQERPKQDQPKQDQPKQDQPKQDQPKQDQPKQDQPAQGGQDSRRNQRGQGNQNNQGNTQNNQGNQGKGGQRDQPNQNNRDQSKGDQNKGPQRDQSTQGDQSKGPQRDQSNQGDQDQSGDDDEAGGRRNRRRRGRERTNRATGQRNEPDTSILEDDVLVPAAGILDVLDNYAFVRTSGYLAGPDDVYVSLSMVRKFALRRGDAIVGQVRQPREGERKEKFNPMVRIDSVNGADPDTAQHRVDFSALTPLRPTERIRMETDATNLTGRVIDLVAPVGKGQRGLITAPAKAGKTRTIESFATSITRNNPECHLMMVLVDERPEEVTDLERSVKGEVISSTFDRPPLDHTTVAELAIERAKRLVELGHDVVVLLDGITRLTRAYNLTVPASGRILGGGVDAAALHPVKQFFGAARNVENGGSLTIWATITVESPSAVDAVILEEFEGTSNSELRLRSELVQQRIFPAIDPVVSSTQREESLLTPQEIAVLGRLRRLLAGREPGQAAGYLLEELKKTNSNAEFLLQVQKATPA